MEYSFNVDHAKKFGIAEAILLKNLIFWIRKNKANNTNFHDGRHWTYNSVRAWEDLFPFWSTKQIRRVLDSLIVQGVVRKGNYNEKSNDRTLWYAIVDEILLEIESHQPEFPFAQTGKCICPNGQMDLSKRTNGFVQTDKCNKADNNPYVKPNNNPDKKQEPSAAFLERLEKVHSLGFKMAIMINTFKKKLKEAKATFYPPEKVYIAVCDEFIKYHKTITGDPWPYFIRILERKTAEEIAGINAREGEGYKKMPANMALMGEIMHNMASAN